MNIKQYVAQLKEKYINSLANVNDIDIDILIKKSKNKETLQEDLEKMFVSKTIPFKGLSLFCKSNRHELLTQIAGAVVLNFNGEVIKIFNTTNIENLDILWFEPCNNGGLSIFGFNSNGDIIFGIAKYDGGIDGLYEEDCFYMTSANSTNPFID